MKIIEDWENKKMFIEKEDTDDKIYNDSHLMYKIKEQMKESGHDVVKKLAYKDGHMVDDTLYYIRERKHKYFMYDPTNGIHPSYEDFNHGVLTLNIAGEKE